MAIGSSKEGHRAGEIQSRRWWGIKDATGSETLPKLIACKIGQAEEGRRGEERPESEAPGRLNFRLVTAYGLGKIGKILRLT